MVFQLLVMSGVLGASTFAVGMLPLSYAFSSQFSPVIRFVEASLTV